MILLLSIFLLSSAMIVLTYAIISPSSIFTQIIHGQTPTIDYKPNQKQTTFFEKYPTDGPTFTPVPIPSSTPGPTDPPEPTDPASTPAPHPTTGTLNVCPVNQEVPNNCICAFEGYSDRVNYLCNAPPNNSGILKYLYTALPSKKSYLYASFPYKFIGSVIGPMPEADWEAAIKDPSCHRTCIEFDKPIIYLYPEYATEVSVRLEIPGYVTKSIPHYPVEGWQHILAHPDGTFTYQGAVYNELFYETSVPDLIPRKRTGLVIRSRNLAQELPQLLERVGLQGREKTEFIEYWLPRLQALHTEAVFVRLLTHEEKNLSDKVVIEPQPDTFIEALFEFYPVPADYQVAEMKLPPVPERNGFTAVEWGGAIMNLL